MPEKVFNAYQKSKESLASEVEVERKLLGMAGGGTSAGISFLITVLDLFYREDHTKDEIINCVTDGRMDLSFCDLVKVHPDGSVDIFDVKESENTVKATHSTAAKLGLKLYFLKKPRDLSACNPVLRKQINAAHSTGITGINLYFVRGRRAPIKDFDKWLKNGSLRSVQIITREELVRMKLQDSYLPSCVLTPEDEGMKSVGRRGGGLNSIVLQVSLKELLKIYDEHKNKGVDFFASNVRNPRNNLLFASGLEQTLKEDPDKFHLFHNGITMTASLIKQSGATYKISEPQIVNGGQTLGNIAYLVKERKIDTNANGAFVLCKVVRAEEELIDDICESSNTQRKVTAVDLRSNDIFQKELTVFIDSVGKGRFSYERKPKQGKRAYAVITLDKFYQWVHSSMRSRPHEAKNLKNRLFAKSRKDYKAICAQIKKNSTHIERLCETGLFVENEIRGIADKKKKGLARDMNNHIISRLYRTGKKKNASTCDSENFNKAFLIFKNAYRKYKKLNSAEDPGSFFKRKESALKKYIN